MAILQVVVGISPVGAGYGYITLSSVTGIKSRSSIRACISGWYSAGNHLFRSELQSVRSLIWSLRDVPGMGAPVRFHWIMRSAMSMWAALCSSVALRWRMSLTVMFKSGLFFYSDFITATYPPAGFMFIFSCLPALMVIVILPTSVCFFPSEQSVRT